ncbi:MAG: HsmA family protein [Coriobacteriia bacterium]|nr:HsmA family protein [Coriobacteriia bacterium]
MSATLMTSTILITLALVFYTIGVWAERISRYLKPWHLAAFWLGLAFDAGGTYAMDLLEPGVDWLSVHTITGQIAIWLMFAHAAWATWVVRKGTEEARRRFHRFSFFVWLVWLVPYIGGMLAGMGVIGL